MEGRIMDAAWRAGIPERWRMYDLRHRRITLWLKDGKPLAKVMEVAGHSQPLASGEAAWIESLDDVEGIAEWAGGDYFPRIWLNFRETKAVRAAPVGRCTEELVDARPWVEFALRWMEERLRGDITDRTR